MLSIVITDKGVVRDAKVVTGLDKDLDKQALKAVGAWRFEPATKDGKPVAVRVKVEADTFCVHGDEATGVKVAGAVRKALEAAGVQVVKLTDMKL